VRKQQRGRLTKKVRRLKNPVAAVDEHLSPFPHLLSIASVPGVAAVLERARTPYRKNPLSEDEALNLICDARSGEPTYPLEKLLKKFKHELADATRQAGTLYYPIAIFAFIDNNFTHIITF
jgi:hypothetical protein